MPAESPALARWLEHRPGLHDQKTHGRRKVGAKLKAAVKALVDDDSDLHPAQRDMLAGLDPERRAKLAADFRAHNARLAQRGAPARQPSPARADSAPMFVGLAPDPVPGPAPTDRPTQPTAQAANTPAARALAAAPVELGDEGFDRGGDDLDDADVEAMREYRDGVYEEFNDYKRALGRGEDPDDIDPGGDLAAMAAQVDNVFARSKLTEQVVAYRGVGDLGRMLPGIDTTGSLVGVEYVEDAPASTTVDRRVSAGFGSGGALLNITVPAGVGAVQLSKHYDGEINAMGRPSVNDTAGSVNDLVRVRHYEAELLVQDGLRYRITGDRTVDGRRELDVEVVP